MSLTGCTGSENDTSTRKNKCQSGLCGGGKCDHGEKAEIKKAKTPKSHITKILLKYQYRNFLNNKDLKYTHIAHVSYYTSLVSKLENDLLLRYKYDEGGILC
jgi:hypothetical protein